MAVLKRKCDLGWINAKIVHEIDRHRTRTDNSKFHNMLISINHLQHSCPVYSTGHTGVFREAEYIYT